MEGEGREQGQHWAREKIEQVVQWVKRGGFWRRRAGQPPETREAQQPSETADPRHIIRLAELGGDVINVGPIEGKWSMHYPEGQEGRKKAVRGLLTKAMEPTRQAATILRPDQLLYDVNDIKGASRQARDAKFQATETVITDVVTNVESYDYERFANFTAELSDLPHAENIDAEALYTLIASERTRQIMLKKYDHPNRQRIIDKTRKEIDFLDSPADQTGMRGILDSVRRTVRRRELGMQTPVPFNAGDTREIDIYMQLLKPYELYTKTGNEDAYRELVAGIQQYYTEETKPEPPSTPEPPKPDEPDKEEPPPPPPPEAPSEDDVRKEEEPEDKPGEGHSTSEIDKLMPPGNATDVDVAQSDEQRGEAQRSVNEAEKAKTEFSHLLGEMDENTNFAEIAELMEQLDQDPKLFEDMKEQLEKQMQAMEQAKKDELQEKIENMLKAGFLDPEAAEQIALALEQESAGDLDATIEQIKEETKRFNAYETRRLRVQPLVEIAYEFLLPYLPERRKLITDNNTLGRHGKLNKTAIRKPIKIMTGQVKNPRMVETETDPELIMMIAVDISNSMALDVVTGQPRDRIDTAIDLVIIYNELLSIIKENHGNTKYAIYAFGGKIIPIKKLDEDYHSTERYEREDGSSSTVKANLMQVLDMSETVRLHQEVFALDAEDRRLRESFYQTFDNQEKERINQQLRTLSTQIDQIQEQKRKLPNSGTRLLEALQRMSTDLHEEQTSYRDWFSSVTVLCDGADSFARSEPQRLQQLRHVVNASAEDGGLRDDNLSVVVINDEYTDNDEDVAEEFSKIVGETRTKQARTLEEIVTQEMERLAANLEHYNDSRR